MKKLLFFFAAILILASCRKIKEEAYVNFDVRYEQTINVPSNGLEAEVLLPQGGATLPFPRYAIGTDMRARLDQYNMKADKIVSISLLHLSLQMAPNFNFLDSVQLYLSAPNMPEQLVAYNYEIPKNVTTLEMNEVKDLNLKEYLLQDTIYFRLNTHVNAIPPTGNPLKVQSTFHVLANPIL